MKCEVNEIESFEEFKQRDFFTMAVIKWKLLT